MACGLVTMELHRGDGSLGVVLGVHAGLRRASAQSPRAVRPAVRSARPTRVARASRPDVQCPDKSARHGGFVLLGSCDCCALWYLTGLVPGARHVLSECGTRCTLLAGQEIMHGRVAEQPDAGRHFQRRGVLGAHVGEQRHEPPKVCFLLCQSLAARSGGCVVRGMGVPGAAWCLPGHLVPAFCAGGNRGEGPPETGAKVPWQGRERCLTLGITSREANLEARRRESDPGSGSRRET